MGRKYDWDAIKQQIELGKYTLKEITEKYKPEGTNFKSAYDYIRKKKQREGWEINHELNKKYTNNVKSKIAEDEIKKEVELRKEYDKMLTNIRRLTYKTVMQERSTDRLRQVKLAMQTLKDCRKEQWEVNEIQEVAKQVEQTITENNISDLSKEEREKRRQELREKFGDG